MKDLSFEFYINHPQAKYVHWNINIKFNLYNSRDPLRFKFIDGVPDK